MVVPTYNRAELLRLCLDSLVGQTMPASRWEAIVVDNGSTDGTSAVITDFADKHDHFHLVTENEPGMSHALNAGVRQARSGVVAFFDDEARAEPDGLEKIAASFATVHPKPVAVGGDVLPLFEHPPPKWFSDSYETFSLGPGSGLVQSSWGCYGIPGANLAIAKSALVELGGFSDRLARGRQVAVGCDTDMLLRVFNAYSRVWHDSEILVHHWVPSRKMTISHQLWRNYRSGVATSKLENTSIVSRRTLSFLLRPLSRVMSRSLSSPKRPHPAAADGAVDTGDTVRDGKTPFSRTLVWNGTKIANRMGRLRGATWF